MNLEQIRAILWLRLKLWRNQFAQRGAVSTGIWIAVMAFLGMAALASGILGIVGGWVAAGQKPEQLLFIWDGLVLAFGFFWTLGLLVEVQRSESIAMGKLLHLPVTLRQVFVFNYVVSHFTPSLLLFLPALAGLGIGMGLASRGWLALALGPLAGFVFALTAWTYCVRGWLAALMMNKRRHRAAVVWITLGFIVLAQLPNVLLNSRTLKPRPHPPGTAHPEARQGFQDQGLPETVAIAHLLFPPGWPGYSVLQLKLGRAGPALGLTLLGVVLGVAGLARAYRATLRFYQGGYESGKAPPASGTRGMRPAAAASKPLLVERSIPGLAEETSALALATLRSLLRAPEVKMALVLPFIMLAVVGFNAARTSRPWPEAIGTLAAAGAAVAGIFAVAPTMSNCFGLDRDGFRALVLAPMDRRRILLAKNVAFFPFAATASVLLLVALKCLLKVSWNSVLAGVAQTGAAFLLFALVCNLVAILFPLRLAAGSLQAKKMHPRALLAVLIPLLTLPLLVTPVMVGPGVQILFQQLGWLPWLPVNLVMSLVVLALAAWIYQRVLPLEARLLQQREKRILREVTEDVE